MTWSRHHEQCLGCSTTERRHVARGFCMACYRRRRRSGELVPLREMGAVVGTPPGLIDEAVVGWGKGAHGRTGCADCGDSAREHCAHGLCRRCYARHYNRAYRRTERGREVLRASLERWLADPQNREVYAATNRRTGRISRDRKHGVGEDIPLGYEALVYTVFGRRCVNCGAAESLLLDHHRPIQDGHGLLHNAVPLCRSCNARKGRQPPSEFYGAWKLTEVEVLLWETRAALDRGCEAGAAA